MARFSYARLVAKVRRDPAFRRRLMKHPKAVLEEEGLRIAPGTTIKVVHNTSRKIYVIIPGKAKLGFVTWLCYRG